MKYYKHKLWTNQERKASQSRAFQESKEYILPARFDDTEIPGILPTIGHIDLRTKSPAEFVQIIVRKLIYSGGTIPSKIIQNTGYIPGLNRRLNPIYDSSHRMYLYADNIAIDGGVKQPLH